jgi:hypothetical protein
VGGSAAYTPPASPAFAASPGRAFDEKDNGVTAKAGEQGTSDMRVEEGKTENMTDAGGAASPTIEGALDRYLIKSGTLSIEVADARTAMDQLVAGVQPGHGYVSNMNEYVDAFGQRSITFQIRIPAEDFDKAMLRIGTLGKLLNKQVNTEDVTEQYVDTDARVRNLKATEQRLVEHLGRSAKLDEILNVEREISRVRGEIEQHEGRLRFLKNRVAYSTISITIQEAPKAGQITPANSFSSANVFAEATRSLIGCVRVVWIYIIWAIVWSPAWLGILLALRFAYKRLWAGDAC